MGMLVRMSVAPCIIRGSILMIPLYDNALVFRMCKLLRAIVTILYEFRNPAFQAPTFLGLETFAYTQNRIRAQDTGRMHRLARKFRVFRNGATYFRGWMPDWMGRFR